jgi:hypothetical protein
LTRRTAIQGAGTGNDRFDARRGSVGGIHGAPDASASAMTPGKATRVESSESPVVQRAAIGGPTTADAGPAGALRRGPDRSSACLAVPRLPDREQVLVARRGVM